MVKKSARDDRQLLLGWRAEEMTSVPPIDWEPPARLPDRLEGDVIGVDLETRDDGLSANRGSGWPWGGGTVVGYAIAADNFTNYLPVRHQGGGNLDPDLVKRWLRHALSDARQVKTFANAQYDLGWLLVEGIDVHGPIVDVQWAEALLDEYRRSYSLDSIARDRLGRRKDEAVLRTVAGALNFDPKSELWRLPSRYVARYAIEDAVLTRDLWRVQQPLIESEGLQRIFDLEHALLPVYLAMRRIGIRVDLNRAQRLRQEWTTRRDELTNEVKRLTGVAVDLWVPQSLARALDSAGVGGYGRTAKTGAPSITAEFLQSCQHAVPKLILEARQLDKLVTTFIDGHVLGYQVNGRVHGEIHPLRGDDGGTVTGRLSMSDPNLQQLPTRTVEGNRIRECFLPEEGEEWCAPDFSSQEPRLLVHFAALTRVRNRPLPGAIEMRDRYREDPDTDLHQVASDIMSVPRKRGKVLNLAIIYGRGTATTATELGLSEEETQVLFDQHDQALPFARETARICQRLVNQRGYLVSLLGRRVRFPFFEPADWSLRSRVFLREDEARARWPGKRLVRARAHKALNSLIQPSAADQTKAAMLELHRAGLTRHMRVQVHDEIGNSVPSRRVGYQIAEIMRDAVQLEIPSKVDVSFGASWGECTD